MDYVAKINLIKPTHGSIFSATRLSSLLPDKRSPSTSSKASVGYLARRWPRHGAGSVPAGKYSKPREAQVAFGRKKVAGEKAFARRWPWYRWQAPYGIVYQTDAASDRASLSLGLLPTAIRQSSIRPQSRPTAESDTAAISIS